MVPGALPFGIVGSAEGLPGVDVVTARPGLEGKFEAASADDRLAPRSPALTPPGAAGVFTRFALDLAAQRPGRTLMVLQAGCTTAGAELDLAALRAAASDLEVSQVDDDDPTARAAVTARPDLEGATLGELRLVPLRPRSFDLVQCSLLLHRIGHAELVLGRLAASVRPGGLLLLHLSDPDSAAGFLDRRLPRSLRVLAWRASRPGQPGPYPARYEPVASARGIEAFASRHGLSIAHRGTASAPGPARGARAAARLVGWLSRGRLSCDHDELCYVIRQPEDRFARVLQ